MLVSNLWIGRVKGQLMLFLSEKATNALMDMLWSRYQLFVQVLNHKTNVGLNAVLGEAMEAAVLEAHLSIPQSPEEYVEFTDDHVMSKVVSACLRGELKDRPYAKALVRHRHLPVLVQTLRQDGAKRRNQKSVDKARAAKADELRIQTTDIRVGWAESHLIKEAPLPTILSWDRSTGRSVAESFPTRSLLGTLRTSQRLAHLFVDRDVWSSLQQEDAMSKPAIKLEPGTIASFSLKTGEGRVKIGSKVHIFPLTCFQSGRPSRFPRKGENVEVLFSPRGLFTVRVKRQ